jgi:hypothetical protein
MKTTCSTLMSAMLVAVFAIHGSPGTADAQSCVVGDQFSDNDPSPDWTPFTTDSSRLQCLERNGRVEFPSPNDNVGAILLAGQMSAGWKIDLDHDWAVSLRYRLTFNSPTYGDTGLGFVVAQLFDPANPALFTGYSLSGGTENYGFDNPYEVTRFWQNGTTEIQTTQGRIYSDSTIYVWYDASTDRISHGPDLNTPWSMVTGLRNLTSASTAFMGLVGYSFGLVPSSTGDQVWGDDFCLLYGRVVGSSVGACCVDDTCVQTIETSCLGSWQGAGSFCDDGSPGCESCSGDLTSDGLVDGADLNVLLGDWGQPASIADINADGLVDGGDLNILLGAWGLCP